MERRKTTFADSWPVGDDAREARALGLALGNPNFEGTSLAASISLLPITDDFRQPVKQSGSRGERFLWLLGVARSNEKGRFDGW